MGKFGLSRFLQGRIIAAGAAVGALAIAAPIALRAAPGEAGQLVATLDHEIGDFYRSRGGAPLWFAPHSGNAAPQLVQLLASSQADHLNPRRYNVRALERAVAGAQTGDPGAIQRSEAMLSAAFVTYVRDLKHDPGVGIIYVDHEPKPAPPPATDLLTAAARAPS